VFSSNGGIPYETAIKLPLSEVARLASDLNRYNKEIEKASRK
jgi:hypothetical protein